MARMEATRLTQFTVVLDKARVMGRVSRASSCMRLFPVAEDLVASINLQQLKRKQKNFNDKTLILNLMGHVYTVLNLF